MCCVGCNNTKDEIKGISIDQIPFYGDTRSEAVKRRGKWISFVNGNRKHWTPSKYSGALLGAFRTRRFHSHVSLFFRLTVLSEATEIGVLPVSQFYRPNVEQRYSTQDRSSIASPFGKIYLTSRAVVALCALDKVKLYCFPFTPKQFSELFYCSSLMVFELFYVDDRKALSLTLCEQLVMGKFRRSQNFCCYRCCFGLLWLA